MLLISDANILIDMEAGRLLEKLFELPMQIAVADILYWEEIEPGSPGLDSYGLHILEVTGEYIEYAVTLAARYGSAPSYNDYLSLALARKKGCPLLTGDQALKSVAHAEGIKSEVQFGYSVQWSKTALSILTRPSKHLPK